MSHVLIPARAPPRVGLAGGDTDVPRYCDLHGGFVLNAAIDRDADAVIKRRDEPFVRLMATDQMVPQGIAVNSPLPLNAKLDLRKAMHNYVVQHCSVGVAIPLELSAFCEGPVGSGHGTSSALVVALRGFRSMAGAEAFATIRSYLSTLPKQSANLYESLVPTFQDNSATPRLG